LQLKKSYNNKMMKKIYAITTMFTLLCVLLCFKISPEQSYEVIDVVSGDMFVLDLNHNGEADEDELFHLKDINAFPLRYNDKAVQYAKEYGLNIDEAITSGYLSKKYLKENLLNKKAVLNSKLEKYNPAYKYRFVKISIEKEDVGKTLLREGLAFAYKGGSAEGEYNEYVQFEIPKKIKSVAKEGLKLNIVAIDKNKKVYHKPDCKSVIYIKNENLDFLPLNEIPKDYKADPFCFEKKQNEEELQAHINKIELPIPDFKIGEIELYLVDPNKYFRPSTRCRTSACQALLKNINEAKVSIDFALYGIEAQDEIFNALVKAKRRGVVVRGVVDSNANSTFIYKDTPKLQKVLSLSPDGTNGFMHNKFFVFDGEKVFTGTMNISNTGSGGYNSNTSVLIHSPLTAQIYTSELEQMLSGKFQKNKEDKSVENITLPSGIKLSVYFSPSANAYLREIRQILQDAETEIFVSAFYLTYKEIVNDLIAAKSRGVDVKIIVDATSASRNGSKVKELREARIPVKVENWGGKSHEKNMVIDKKIFITGSANFSFSGYNKNDENILVITSPPISNYYRTHFLKLFNSIDDVFLTRNPRAESFESKNSCYDGIDNNHDGKIDSKDDGCYKKLQ